ncbi:hypothetical protein HD554DRAFT_1612033 [Boletus coccyginus]|nr:hypothetical protein HD554DRAFT_1612033 [Boletus coccyginus]
MSDLPDGRYFILLATSSAPLPLPVGANLEGSTPPIIVGGKSCIWTAKKLDSGRYTVILEQTGLRWFSQAGGLEVFVAIKPARVEWTIKGQANGSRYPVSCFRPRLGLWTAQNLGLRSHPGSMKSRGLGSCGISFLSSRTRPPASLSSARKMSFLYDVVA